MKSILTLKAFAQILPILIIPLYSFSQTGPDKNLQFSAKKLDNKSVQFLPPSNHYFNLEAPSEVSKTNLKSSNEKAELEKKKSGIKATWKSENTTCEITAQLYLCDDKGTYCVPVKRKYNCDKLSQLETLGSVQTIASNEIKSDNSEKSQKIFIMNDSKKAMELAKNEKKLLMIDFYGVWCPPCNYLDEQVFSRKDFKMFSKDFIFLKMDADDPISWDLKSKFNIKGYPTILFLNNEQEELFRIVGSRKPATFIAEMKKVLKYKSSSLAQRIAKAESLKDPESAFSLAEMAASQENYAQALNYYTLALKNGNWTEQRRNQMLSAQINLLAENKDEAGKKVLANLIETSFVAFPYGYEAYERSSLLISIAEDLKDESLKNRAFNAQFKNAAHLLNNPSLYKNTELDEPSLHVMIASVYENSKEELKMKEHYFKAYEAYTKLIKQSGIDEKVERGHNLERIYCLFKAGRVEDANKMYEDMQTTYPTEFTFYYNHASQLKDLGKYAEALPKAQKAYEFSYGDNQLRAVYVLSEINLKLGNKKEAKNLIEETLKNFKAPEGLKVRTHRYLERLKKLI